MKEVAEANLERTVFVQFSKGNVVERPARAILRLMSHDASHHLFDIERMRKA